MSHYEYRTTISNSSTCFEELLQFDMTGKHNEIDCVHASGYIFDFRTNCYSDYDIHDIFDSETADTYSMFISCLGDTETLNNIMTYLGMDKYGCSYDDNIDRRTELGKVLVLNRIKKLTPTDERVFVDVVNTLQQHTGANTVIFQAGNILKNEKHSLEKLCAYYDSIEGVEKVNQKENIYVYDKLIAEF